MLPKQVSLFTGANPRMAKLILSIGQTAQNIYCSAPLFFLIRAEIVR